MTRALYLLCALLGFAAGAAIGAFLVVAAEEIGFGQPYRGPYR